MCWRKRCPCFACESWWLLFFCQPVHCACVKMTSHVGKHETSYSLLVLRWWLIIIICQSHDSPWLRFIILSRVKFTYNDSKTANSVHFYCFVKVSWSLCSVEHGSEEQPPGHPPVRPANEQPRARAALAAVRAVRPWSAGQCQPGYGHSGLCGSSHHQQLTDHRISAPTSQVWRTFSRSVIPFPLPFLPLQR